MFRITRLIPTATLLVLALCTAGPASAAELLVGFEASVSKAQVDDAVAGAAASGAATEVTSIPQIRTRVLRVPSGRVDQVVARLRASGRVTFVDRNDTAGLRWVPNDPHLSKQWHLNTIRMQSAWNVTRGRSDVIVAVVDTGVDYKHPDLVGRVLPGYDFFANDADPMDEYQHGTAIAGIIAATADNGVGIAGIAPNVKILPVRVSDLDYTATKDNVAKGIIYAADKGARVINISLGWDTASAAVEAALKYAVSKGALPVCATENRGDPWMTYPEKYEECFAVGASTSADTLAAFSDWGSNWGDGLDLVAPGAGIYTTTLPFAGLSYEYTDGTSVATPMVAAAAALVASTGASSVAQMRNALTKGAKDLGTAGYDVKYGWGRLDVLGALNWSTATLPPQRYRVNMCANGTSRAFTPAATAGWTASFIPASPGVCPAENYAGATVQGLVTRPAWGTSSTPLASGASQIFAAPAGTTIVGMWWSGQIYADNCNYHVGFGGNAWLLGRRGGAGCSAGPYSLRGTRRWVPVGGERLYQTVQCAVSSCSNWAGQYAKAEVITFAAEVEISDTTAPVISVTSGLLGATASAFGPVDNVSGTVTVRWDLKDASGIAASGTAINAQPVLAARACDFGLPKPCADQLAASQVIDTRTLPNGSHHFVISAKDAAGNIANADRWFNVVN